MRLPYRLGCPSWAGVVEPFYTAGGAVPDALADYCAVFNAVEGNTTFYALPSPATVSRWAAHMPADFRFCAKVPRTISHESDLRDAFEATTAFLVLLEPLRTQIAPLWLQLSPAFGPGRLVELLAWLDGAVSGPVAVEVRHPAFFARGDEERALNRALRDRGIERIGFDTRALFASRSTSPAVLDAQRRKPRLPVRVPAFGAHPQVRFVGGPDLAMNDAFLMPWVDKVAEWIEAGLEPFVFCHMPENRHAALQAQRFHALLQDRLPGLPALPTPVARQDQFALL